MKKPLAYSLSLATIGFCAAFTGAAQASLVDQYFCDVCDMGIIVFWSSAQSNQVNVDISVSEMMEQSLARQYVMPLVEEGGDARIIKGDGTIF